MKIAKVSLSNFRCFGPQPTTIEFDDLTTLVGANGTGKSAVLQALKCLFGVRSADRRLSRGDFHVPLGTAPDAVEQISLWIEARLEFPGVGAGEDAGVPECFKQMMVEEEGSPPFCRIRVEGVWRRTAQSEGEIEEKLSWIKIPVGEPTDNDKSPMANYDRSRLQVIYVPAVRDPARQLRQSAGALLQPLLRAINWSEETRTTATDSVAKVREAVRGEIGLSRLETAIANQWRLLQEFPPLREVQLQPFTADFESLLRQMEAVFRPGHGEQSQPIERLSEGLRSLFYFSILGARFELERAEAEAGEAAEDAFDFAAAELPALTFFAIEEPENHLAPHYLARILTLLTTLASHRGAQVALTSQSPAILARVEPENVRHLRMDLATARVRIRRITLPAVNAGDAYKYVKEAVRAYPELYFASAVVLGEGDSESIVLPRLARALGQTFDQRFVSVVPLGGRHVNHFWRLLNELEIPHLTLLDLDRERFGGGWSRIHYAINQLITFVPNSSAANFGITAQQLAEMPTWPLDNPQGLSNWATSLEARGIFFSSPLDLDFAMLQGFENAYHEAKTGPGPNIPAAEEPLAERVSRAIRAVLKSEGGSGATYTAAEKTAFIWYQYLFLNRGKPATHLLALTKVTDQQIQINIPQVLRRLLDRVNTILNPQPNAPPPPPQVA